MRITPCGAIIVAFVLFFGTATYSSLCKISSGSMYFEPGPLYCLKKGHLLYRIHTDCPCRIQGSVLGEGYDSVDPIYDSIHEAISEWGNALGTVSVSQSGIVDILVSYDITLQCGQAYKVTIGCTTGNRPQSIYYVDQGACEGSCEDPPPEEG